VEFKTQRDIAEFMVEHNGSCSGVRCDGDSNQPVACPLWNDGICTSGTAARWLQENGHLSDGEPEQPKKFGDLDPQEQEVIRKAYAEGRCESQTVEKTWFPVIARYGPYDDSIYRISEPQHQSDGGMEGPAGRYDTIKNCRCAQVTVPVETFESGAVRDTNANKPRPELISPFFTERLAQVLAEGAVKYDDDNWSKGIPMRRCLASLERHLIAFKKGKTDEDHLGHAAANVMFLIHFDETRPDLNDMPNYELR